MHDDMMMLWNAVGDAVTDSQLSLFFSGFPFRPFCYFLFLPDSRSQLGQYEIFICVCATQSRDSHQLFTTKLERDRHVFTCNIIATLRPVLLEPNNTDCTFFVSWPFSFLSSYSLYIFFAPYQYISKGKKYLDPSALVSVVVFCCSELLLARWETEIRTHTGWWIYATWLE